ncbi:RNA polymerase sigma factor [Candidatus Roizmanbacteria bacterium]|jgi:RNA polymerase sigma-70 factor (ECF subfamily)|nr:RNA polymerase sigma factor [Candidatus Roizmanbacteria bacterium]
MSCLQEDKNIVKKIINRDEKALLHLYRQYQKDIFYFVDRRLNDHGLSEEITQDVFVDFLDGLRDFRYQSSLKTFLFSIAKNKTIDVIRKKKIKKIFFSALPQPIVEGLKVILIDDEIDRREMSEKIKKALGKLPNDYQFVLRLKYMEGIKVREISRKLRLGFKATESLIFRARKAFVNVFEK